MHIFLLGLSMLLIAGASALAENVTYMDDELPLTGYLVKTENIMPKPPGVLILPAWKGVDEHGKDSANKLSKLGYISLVADIYGTSDKPLEMKEAMEFSGYYKEHFEAYQKRISLALDELVHQGADLDRLAIVGYCFGGTGALEAARGNLPVRGVVSVHGGLGKDVARPNGEIKTKVLVLHGADDPHVSVESITTFVNEMREGHADWQMIWYADAVHAFSDPYVGNDKSKGAAYNPIAARRSWEHMELFLKELFQ
ncbi:MAG: dienelactone hydrolase family protein [Abditibacteriaceae bacterium]